MEMHFAKWCLKTSKGGLPEIEQKKCAAEPLGKGNILSPFGPGFEVKAATTFQIQIYIVPVTAPLVVSQTEVSPTGRQIKIARCR